MKQVHLIITGDVIGVGFRAFIVNQAKKLNLTGWVKNVDVPQRAVEAVFQGEKEDIDKMIELCKKGPEISWVKGVDVTNEKVIVEFDGFTIITIK